MPEIKTLHDRGLQVEDTFVARAPTRIDFGGGWTDVPPYSDEVGGFVCNLAIGRYATVTVVRRVSGDTTGTTGGHVIDRSIVDAAVKRFHLHDARVTVHSDFPIGAGLGGSSATGVAALAALAAARGETVMRPGTLAELSREIEVTDLGIAGGRQDHYAAAYGGALGLRFIGKHVDVRDIAIRPKVRTEIERRCIVVYTGQSRVSGETINAVMGAYKNREPRVLAALQRMRETAEQMADVLAAGNLDSLGALVAEQWIHQRSLHPSIPTPLIDEIIARAHEAGTVGAKALGASGGGCVLLIAKTNRVDEVKAVAESLGELLPFKVDELGVELCE